MKKQKTLSASTGEREKFGSRLGFLLISAGCAIGLGNVWRFPYVTAKFGGAAFVLMYLIFLVVFGLPIMTMEFAVGRGSGKSIARAFDELEPKKTKWHLFSGVGIAGNYLLMMFYTVVTAWMFIYMFKTASGSFVGQSPEQISAQFDAVTANPLLLVLTTLGVIALGMFICSFGVKKGLERINKIMMLALLALILVLVVYVATIDGTGKGYEFYLVPDFTKIKENFWEAMFAAMGQAFFTLSIGMGSMAIFGSYIKKDKRLFGESLTIAVLDTGVAFCAGLVIIPACMAFNLLDINNPDLSAGPGLIFKTLPNVFNNMGNVAGRILGTVFFLFMIFAALSTVSAVFENIIAYCMEKWNWSRKKACLINIAMFSVLVLPCIFGFNILSFIKPLGEKSTILDLEDFLISNNILILGSLVFVLFCTSDKHGWGWNNFLTEANLGKGLKTPSWLRVYAKYILPVLLLVFWVWGYISMFL